MSAARDTQAERSLKLARDASLDLKEAQLIHHTARLRFLRDAQRAGWTWDRIGACLAVSSNGARQFWSRHRHEAGRLSED